MTLISREILQRALRWSKKRKILTALFAVYIFAVLWLTLIDRQWGERQAELVPFWEVRNLLENISIKYLRDFWLVQIFGNIAAAGVRPLPIISGTAMVAARIASICCNAKTTS